MALALRAFAILCASWALAPNLCAQGSSPASPPPISLEEYAAKNGINNEAAIQFISLRCTALYMFSAGMLQNDNAGMAAQFEEGATRFLALAFQTAKRQEDFVRDQVQRMSRMYSDRARAAKANTGNVFEDTLLRSDMFFCKPIAEKLR